MKLFRRAALVSTVLLLCSLRSGNASFSQETLVGYVSDSMCGASHAKVSSSRGLTDRQCVIECIRSLANYVLVDENKKVIPILNQDFVGLPYHAGRRVKVQGEIKAEGIMLSSIEAASPVE